MAKAQDAFRTISEVSEILDTPAHVLRFWESKFSQIKPVKRAGGRRYYRPDDLALLSGIKKLLHDQGMTIKGAQKLIREKGIKHIIGVGEEALVLWSDDPNIESVDEVVASAPDIAPERAAAPEVKSESVSKPAPMPDPTIISDSEPKPESVPETKAEPVVVATTKLSKPATAPGLTFAPTPPPVADFSTPPQPKEVSARFFGSFTKADPDKLHARAAKIAPLVARLEAVHAQMVRS